MSEVGRILRNEDGEGLTNPLEDFGVAALARAWTIRAARGMPPPPMEIFRVYRFEAAHRLPAVPPGHKCSRLHGHSYAIEVRVRGPVGADTGWIVDLGDLDLAWEPLHQRLDHHYLNDVEGLDNPTSENLARWIWRRLRPGLPMLCEIGVRETCTCGCTYRGEDEPEAR